MRVDAFAFRNMPRAWRGEPNPLAAGGRPSPSDAYGLTLVPDADALMERALSRDARKKLRQKEKYLAEIGPVSCRAARDEGEVDAFLAAFLEQKRLRFRELGIPDPFACEGVRGFLRAAALAGLERGAPALELHALLAGERVVAVLGAAVDARRCCGMFISFDPDPPVARCSPGDVLLARVVPAQARSGRTAFDLGVGEAAYKTRLCSEVEPLVDLHLPVTPKGRAFALAAEGFARAKRAVKRSPALWKLALRIRAALAGRRG